MPNQKVLIIGEVYVDVHLDLRTKDKRTVRLGGIFHAIRTLCALNIDVAVAYFAPTFLQSRSIEFLSKFGIKDVIELGIIDQSPNVMLICESKETGNQGYEDILRAEKRIMANNVEEKLGHFIELSKPSSILVFPSAYPIDRFFKKHLIEPSIKVLFDRNDFALEELKESWANFSYAFSSSSTICNFTADQMAEFFSSNQIPHDFLLYKENRGGSVIFSNRQTHQIPAFLSEAKHSVGVGDSYDAALLAFHDDEFNQRGRKASYVASLYSQTFDYEVFKENLKIMINDDFRTISVGLRFAWNERSKFIIYLAGPDFPNVDTRHFDEIEGCLIYHNFSVVRPIKKFGLINPQMSLSEKDEIIKKDFDSLQKAAILVAIMVDNDPGMFSEIGYFACLKKPIILFDPNRLLENSFVKNCISVTTHSLDELLIELFLQLGEKI